jgi:hypothetical protein
MPNEVIWSRSEPFSASYLSQNLPFRLVSHHPFVPFHLHKSGKTNPGDWRRREKIEDLAVHILMPTLVEKFHWNLCF